MEIAQPREPVLPRGIDRHRDQLVIAGLVVVGHLQHADDARPRDVTALDRAPEHDDVERVAVVGERARHHAVVDQERQVIDLATSAGVAIVLPVQPAIVVGDLELRGRAARNFDDRVDRAIGVLRRPTGREVMDAGDGLGIERERLGRDGSAADDRTARNALGSTEEQESRGERNKSEHTRRVRPAAAANQDTISDIYRAAETESMQLAELGRVPDAMSSVDSVDLRPRRPLRIAVLIAAVACLGLTMCVRSEQKRAPAKPAPETQVQPQAPQPPAQGQKVEPAPAKPDYFPATKAPGGFYR